MIEEEAIIQFLKYATPFQGMDLEKIKLLVTRLQKRTVVAGTPIILQGETGDTCFLVRKGSVDVVSREEGHERSLAVLKEGSLFGEAALLTDSPRNATVRALEPTELLVLKRADLIEVMIHDRDFSVGLFEMLRLRDRPLRLENILSEQQTTTDGSPITILKNSQNGTYYRLSPEGVFLWERLDGKHNLKDLTLEFFSTFKKFNPYFIAETVSGLVVSGFAQSRVSKVKRSLVATSLSWSQKFFSQLRQIFEWRVVIRSVDPVLTSIYRQYFQWIYTWSFQILMLITGLAGLGFFIFQTSQLNLFLLKEAWQAVYLLFLVPALFLSTFLHEIGHAFTTKAFKREVLSIGFGWYWISPIFYVDTSDMWLESKWRRVAVSFAGPYVNFFLGGVASLVGYFTPILDITTVSWIFTAGSYGIVLMNMNPLLKYDGHYIFNDLRARK